MLLTACEQSLHWYQLAYLIVSDDLEEGGHGGQRHVVDSRRKMARIANCALEQGSSTLLYHAYDA